MAASRCGHAALTARSDDIAAFVSERAHGTVSECGIARIAGTRNSVDAVELGNRACSSMATWTSLQRLELRGRWRPGDRCGFRPGRCGGA